VLYLLFFLPFELLVKTLFSSCFWIFFCYLNLFGVPQGIFSVFFICAWNKVGVGSIGPRTCIHAALTRFTSRSMAVHSKLLLPIGIIAASDFIAALGCTATSSGSSASVS